MKIRKRNFLLIVLLIGVFVLVYSPHFSRPFPMHIDEWHHITESIKLKEGGPRGIAATKAGFHYFLLILGKFTDIVLSYKFLAATLAVVSALALFYVVRNKTANLKKSYFIAIFSIIFFASIKSNVNITGLWFATPLTFSIPFIYLYIYFFDKGFKEESKKYVLISLAIMLFLIPIHSISVLFSLPFLLIYSLFHLEFIRKESKFFLLFLLVPIIGVLFYGYLMNLKIIPAIADLLSQLQFRQGWGVLEVRNSFFELYSMAGYVLAFFGLVYIASSRIKFRKYLIYLLWPLTVLVYILIFRFTGTSYLTPYQRNLYYFAISLPFLSALGLYYVFIISRRYLNKFEDESSRQRYKLLMFFILIVILFFTFKAYYDLPADLQLYKTINEENYEAIKFLSSLESGKVMAPAEVSTAIFPISGQKIVASIFFYGDRNQVEQFFGIPDCRFKELLIKNNEVSYVLSEQPIECGWEVIYDRGNWVYAV